ncbi:YfcE family phosphodiesterase [Orenia metallireducens]|uniref:Phosphoesterase n=1 Tax=Orenia metallireducens TaxID=1413210 RepID=A0A1C0A5D4_9FIRM|nr:metallophosphoesterase [Orenia metallireducens]OCL25351.1 YfcE family phosphodiesterase [Orenia metallireducens]
MKLVIFSDSHGQGQKMNQVVQELEDIDYIIYAGDIVGDLKEVEILDDIKLLAVRGNCDYSTEYPEDQLANIGNMKLFLTHGHNYMINYGLDKLYYKAKEVEADIVIFGHSHRRYAIEEDGILFFNPGSISSPRDGKAPSYGIIEIRDNKIIYKHFDFKSNN